MVSTTVCLRSSDPIYLVTYYIKWVTTFLTHSMSNIRGTITRYILEYLFGNADVQEASGHHHHAANRARRQVQSVQHVLSKKSQKSLLGLITFLWTRMRLPGSESDPKDRPDPDPTVKKAGSRYDPNKNDF